jgi:hypothetical protein
MSRQCRANASCKDLVMAPPTVRHQEGLTAVAPTAVGGGFEGVFALLLVVVSQGDFDHHGTLPDSDLGG